MRMVRKAMVGLLLRYLSSDPMRRLSKIFVLAEKLDRDNLHDSQIQIIKKALSDENSNWYLMVKKLFAEVDMKIIRKVMESFFVNANLEGAARARAAEREYDCN